MKAGQELPIPEAVSTGEHKVEMARIWLVDGQQVITLSNKVWDDPRYWGLLLVDLARHVSKVYEPLGMQQEEVLAKIKEALDVEWSSPTG